MEILQGMSIDLLEIFWDISGDLFSEGAFSKIFKYFSMDLLDSTSGNHLGV